jgi:hypothetical protein
MTIVLKYVVNCDILGLIESFQSSSFNHAFSKACQYSSTNENVYKGFEICIC